VIPDATALEAVHDRLDAVAVDAAFEVAEREGGIAVTDADGIEVRVRTP
jgi:catechol 2,3-dioxygenase